MDPSMFVLTAGVISFEFALAKTIAAIGLGVFGGTIVHILMKKGTFANPLREGFGNGGCVGAKFARLNLLCSVFGPSPSVAQVLGVRLRRRPCFWPSC